MPQQAFNSASIEGSSFSNEQIKDEDITVK